MISQDFLNKLLNQLIIDEGYRQHPYRDTKGILTIGVGRNLESDGISKEEAKYLATNNINEKYQQLISALPWFTDLDEVRQCVLINMGFNMGVPSLLNFKVTLNFIAHGDYEKASEEMLNSLWAKQVGNRAERLAQMMRTGKSL